MYTCVKVGETLDSFLNFPFKVDTLVVLTSYTAATYDI